MSNYAPVRGLDPSQELASDSLMRDVRPTTKRIVDALRSVHTMVLTLVAHAVVVWQFPALGTFALLSASLLAWWGLTRKESAPIKMPIQCGLLDPNELHPATKKPREAKGIFHIGTTLPMGMRTRDSGKQVWLTNDDCRQHFLVVGTTGAGKTEALLGFATNALTWGSGLLYCDGKGDVSLYAKMYALARRFGREDDLLVLNLMTGNTTVGAGGGRTLSNTLNPFTSGSADSLTQMVTSLMDDVGGDGAMWKGRAIALFTGVMGALVWKRDEGMIDLNIGIIRDYMNLPKIIELADKEKEPHMPLKIRSSLDAYLASLPGFVREKGTKQGQTTLDQHGFLQMQFTRILGSLTDVYGHIFLTPHGEVDMNDVVLNRRILVVMLPALEKSSDEVANLGKIIVATLKGMMGSTLGNTLEDDWDKVVDARPYNSPSPFIVILDEVGYYCVNGMAIMAAQGRSLGFSIVFATQDIPAMMRENDKEAKSIIANTTTKLFMRVEELEATAKLAIDSGGEGLKAQTGGFSGKSGEFNMSYLDGMEARIEKVNRISSLDLRALGVGEAYVTWHDQYFKVKTFHAFPEGEYKNLPKLELRVNHFIAVARPNPTDVKREETLPQIAEKLQDARFAQIVEARAIEARGAIEQAAAQKRDPAKMKSEIACAAVAFLRANKKTGPGGDYLTASCAAIAAITLAQINDAHVFSREVRRVEGLPEMPLSGGLPATARSGKSRVPSQVPGVVSPAARAGAGGRPGAATGHPGRPLSQTMPPPMLDDEPPPPDDMEFETEPDYEDGHAFTDSFGRPDAPPTDPARIEAQRSEAPSTMRKVDHGVTVEARDGRDSRDTFKMAEKLQTNDATLRFLAALNFDADEGSEPGVEVVDTAIEKAVIFDDEDDARPLPGQTADPAEIERADVASARATQWTERAAKPAAQESRAPVPDLETAVKSGNVEDMTASFLADLLEE